MLQFVSLCDILKLIFKSGRNGNVKKNCPKCGSKLMKDAIFCARCGENVAAGGTSYVETQPIQQPVSQQESYGSQVAAPKKKRKTLLIVSLVAGILLISAVTLATLELTGVTNIFGKEKTSESVGKEETDTTEALKGKFPKKATEENSDGVTYIYMFDANGNKVRGDGTDGYWWKSEYDSNGNEIYYENSDGYWCEFEYEENGNERDYPDSNSEMFQAVYNGVTPYAEQIVQGNFTYLNPEYKLLIYCPSL